MVQNGQMTRDEALALARRYDHEFPEEHIDDVLEYLGMSREELDATIDLHRNSELWRREGDTWALSHPLPGT